MSSPNWLKPLLIGSVLGAAVLGVAGFGWAGWMTSGKAHILAADQSREAVVEALVPFCVMNANNDPEAAIKFAALKEASDYERSQMVMDDGWSTIEGRDGPDRRIAGACLEKLADRI